MSNLFAFGDKVIGGGESSQSDGHIIQNPSGTAMPTQPNLQFADANVSNDSTNNATVVRNFVDINWEDWQEVDDNDDTYYRVTDAPLVDGNVEVDLMKKLWENPSPNASFVAQTVTLASDDYDFLYYYFRESQTGSYKGVTIPKGKSCVLDLADIGNNGNTSRKRLAGYVDSTHISFSVGYVGNSSSVSENTSVLIPQAIYGIKQKVTISLSAIISNVSTSASNCMLSDGETSVEDTLNYSIDEHVVGKWIDGSTLYEKTVDCGALPNNTTKNVAHGISNIKYIIDSHGWSTNSDEDIYITLSSVHTGNVTYQCRLYATKNYICLQATSDQSSWNKSYVTIRYTKTS